MTEIKVEETYEWKETSLFEDVTLLGPIENKRSLFDSNSLKSFYETQKQGLHLRWVWDDAQYSR